MREAVKSPTKEWPDEYPAAAVEWLMVLPNGPANTPWPITQP